MPTDDGIWLHEEKGRSPIRPDLGQNCSEDAVTLTQAWALGSVLQGGELLAKGEILGCEFGLVTQHSAEEQQRGTNQAHFNVSRGHHRCLKTVAEPFVPSNRKCLIDNAYGVLATDTVDPTSNVHSAPIKRAPPLLRFAEVRTVGKGRARKTDEPSPYVLNRIWGDGRSGDFLTASRSTNHKFSANLVKHLWCNIASAHRGHLVDHAAACPGG